MATRWLHGAGLVLCISQLRVYAQCDQADPEAILHQLLGDSYVKSLRPNHLGPPTEVTTQLDIQSLVAVNPKKHYFEVMGYWRTSWMDPRLNYTDLENASCFPTIKLNLTETPDKPPISPTVWTPDLYFDNAKEEFYGLHYFWFGPSGKVLRSIRIKHQFECKMDFPDLPFDCHYCPIRLMSYSETASNVILAEKDGKGVTLNQQGAAVTEWTIESRGSEVEKITYGTGGDVFAWDHMRLDVMLSRTALYHMRTDVFYTILFIMMTYCGFFISRSAAPARVTIAVIPVLAMVNLLNHIDAQLPRIKYSWLSIFLTTSLVFAVSAVVEYGIVWMLLAQEEIRKERLNTIQDLAARLGFSRATQFISEDMTMMVEDPHQQKLSSITQRIENIENSSRKVSGTLPGRPPSCLRPSQEAVFDAAYKIFDPGRVGFVTVQGMRIGLRRFNLYYTPEQTAEIFQQMGINEGERMPKETFIDCMANLPTPAASSDRSFFDRPPSLCLDICTRSAYLPSYVALLVAMLLWSLPWSCGKSA